MIAKQLTLPDTADILYWRRNDDGTITEWFFANGERHEFTITPGPNWKRWIKAGEVCITVGDRQQVMRLEAG